MSGANSTTAALGARMTPSEVGKQKAAEAGIVDFLREAGNALNANSSAAGVSSAHMPRRKTLKTRFVDRFDSFNVDAAKCEPSLP
jgi:chitin synthase